ncbi:capsule biosynthesis protein [Acetobacteraceae bacterium ESL0709]|nr:capsule biosynthesis protein [Acetobacteraceae bacterium ESL0697]MDF7677122.1 capsule biosynthesis protein [Acetobacteraceae bacterium ESL0709]
MSESSDQNRDLSMVESQNDLPSPVMQGTALQKRLMYPFLHPALNETKRTIKRHKVFIFIVILPTIIMAFYLFFIASPQYISETHFLVRGKAPTETSSSGGLGNLLMSEHTGSQDTYAIQDYMVSRDALHMLSKEADIKAIYNRPYADFAAKFPSIFTRKDFESFYKFYRKHVKAQIDEETGISHLTVRTFSALDSQNIAKQLLITGEKLVNDINNRQRYNTLHASETELNNSLKEIHDIEVQLALYRYKNEIIDPEKQSTPMVGKAFSLENSLSMMEAEKKQLDLTAPNSPLRKVYAQRIESLRMQMEKAQSNVTGKKDGQSLVPKLLGYNELLIKESIVKEKIIAETKALEVAKAQADRQMLYVTVVSQPNLPDYAAYPRNILVLCITFITALGVYITGALLVSGAREHAIQ